MKMASKNFVKELNSQERTGGRRSSEFGTALSDSNEAMNDTAVNHDIAKVKPQLDQM